MNLKFKTLNDKFYWVKLENYQAKPFQKVASEFQYGWKRFFMSQFQKSFWAEEFPCRPYLNRKYRTDLYNYTRNFCVECHGKQHTERSDYFHGGSQDKFLDHLVKDREKELWCKKNDIILVKVYESTPKNIEFFIERYPDIFE